MPDGPNVLFLMDDEHRPDVAGYAGDEVVRTPTLDWLAETGTVFTNAYTPAPVCVPARHSIRTGQLPRTWAQAGFEAFESGYRTLPRHLGAYGYMTASAGKEHYPGFAQMQGWRKRLSPTPLKQHGVGKENLDVQDPEAFEEQTGFSTWKWSDAKEVKRAGVQTSRTQVGDRKSVGNTRDYIEQFFSSPHYDRAQPDTPLFLKTSLIQPHYPFFSESEERFSYYLNRVDPYVEDPEDFHPVMSTGHEVVPGEDASERELRRATAAYYAMVETVDALFGAVIDALEHHGEDPDEWIIVFTSDHGEMLGERGVWQKTKFYEPSARVPLIVRYPERFESGEVEANVNLCDLFATLCDLADVPTPDGLDSRSLVSLMDGDTDHWHAQYDNETVSQNVSNGAVRGGMDSEKLLIKRDALKYCYFGEEYEEVLFDLERDPEETTNYIDDPEYADAVETFRKRRGDLGYGPNADPEYETAGYR